MAPLVPNCQWWTAADADINNQSTIQEHMNALHAFFAGTPSHWTLLATETSGTDVTSFVIEQNTDASHQVTIRIDAGDGFMKGKLDPNGTKTSAGVGDLATLTDPTTGFSSEASGEVIFTRAENFSRRGLIAEYPDAVLFLLESNTETYWRDGGHFGKIYSPFNSNDADLGISGHGILGGQPDIGGGDIGEWLSSFNSADVVNYSQVRVGLTTWVPSDLASGDSDAIVEGGLLGGNLRFPSHTLMTGSTAGLSSTPNTEPSVRIGNTKYLRMTDVTRPYLSILFSNSSNQAWQYLVFSSSNTGAVFLWDKTVVP